MHSFVEVYDDALPAELCEQIIARFDSQPDRQTVGQTGSGVDTSKKDSRDMVISQQQDWAPVAQEILNATIHHLKQYVRKYFLLVSGAMSATMKDAHTGELFVLGPDDGDRLTDQQLEFVLRKFYRSGPLIMQRYEQAQGGYHHWHSECYPTDPGCETLHRALLFMFYLNTVDDGGETSFLYQDMKIEPKQGRMVIAPAYFTHTHRGEVPVSGHKYIVTSWILFQRAENIYRQ